ncbi:methyltransferase [Shewanella zhangzhouensis]|uniref:methyltransferase n=1 Tax=Shewanella zhangzhouensis TaxID=2864213 RepID=UPI001C658289|nr:methyltransferase [Shewanella zhangzhouensis]QYK06748.1 SAM-dependent methyltransferase [Shewanella zhangzhouensis]
MPFYSKPKALHAFDAKCEAQKIAFAPISFQAARCLLRFGVLDAIDQTGGASVAEIHQKLQFAGEPLSPYALGVLLDMGLSMGLLWHEDGKYQLDKTGHFLLHDGMSRTNLEFVHHICYQGMFKLEESLLSGTPAGLSQFGDWDTLYPALSSLPLAAKESWFAFDHFYSDHAFDSLLPLVLADKPAHLVDIGGNTGKWARACCGYQADLKVTIMDLPQQLALASVACAEAGFAERIHYHPVDLLTEAPSFVQGADVYWMSQFLDCFSEAQIRAVLSHTREAMGRDSRLYILETFWDKQPNEASAYCVNATSLYFTAIANGNSRMYHSSVFERLIAETGLAISWQKHNIGLGHTLLCCEIK